MGNVGERAGSVDHIVNDDHVNVLDISSTTSSRFFVLLGPDPLLLGMKAASLISVSAPTVSFFLAAIMLKLSGLFETFGVGRHDHDFFTEWDLLMEVLDHHFHCHHNSRGTFVSKKQASCPCPGR